MQESILHGGLTAMELHDS